MAAFDTNPFADPVEVNPFQVGPAGGLRAAYKLHSHTIHYIIGIVQY
uniref:Uncharacterized protein n=1 Tax=Anolis carolinensis TaxID=28377 RepID=A0A803SWY7_ANOCA